MDTQNVVFPYDRIRFSLKKEVLSRVWLYMPVIPALWVTEAGVSKFEAIEQIRKTPSQNLKN